MSNVEHFLTTFLLYYSIPPGLDPKTIKLPQGDLVAADEITPQIINPKSDANPLSVSPLIAYYCSLLLIIGIGLVVFCQ